MWSDRCGLTLLRLPQTLRRKCNDIAILGLHGPFSDDELINTLSCSAQLLGQKCDGANAVVIGDWNIDMLPESLVDFFADHPARDQHQLECRQLAKVWADTNALHVTLPSAVHDTPVTQWDEPCALALITRVPNCSWEVPSCLDWAMQSSGCNVTGDIFWQPRVSDHAIVVLTFKARVDHERKRRTTWKRTDWQGAWDGCSRTCN
jgi:hypothetical protein